VGYYLFSDFEHHLNILDSPVELQFEEVKKTKKSLAVVLPTLSKPNFMKFHEVMAKSHEHEHLTEFFSQKKFHEIS
jgi:hypothetical protein